MASLDDFPIGNVLEVIRRVNDRLWDRQGRLYEEVDTLITIDEARLISAAAMWIDVLMTAEVKVEQGSEFDLSDFYWMIKDKTHSFKIQSPAEKWLHLKRDEMKMMMAIEAYLDRYASRSKTGSRSNWRRGKKN